MSLKWENIIKDNLDRTERLQVPEGWLVCRITGDKMPLSIASWFVSDPNHVWNPNA